MWLFHTEYVPGARPCSFFGGHSERGAAIKLVLYYRCHGLKLSSEIIFPELAESDSTEASVTLKKGLFPATLPGAAFRGHIHQIKFDQVQIELPGENRLLAQNGSEILVDLSPGADLPMVRNYLLGSVLGAILHQRGVVPMHASAVIVEGRAFLFMGPKRAGKSTTAALLYGRGHQVLTDDIAGLRISDEGVRISQGKTCLWLGDEALKATGLETNYKLKKAGKSAVLLSPASKQNYEVSRIYLLEPGTHTFSRLRGRDIITSLMEHTYRKRFIKYLGVTETYLRHLWELSKRVPVFRVGNPKDWTSESFIEQFERHTFCTVSEAHK